METINITIYGRGGQGAKTCAQIIAEAGLKAGKYIQAFPEYGPERRGAPVKAFVRISNKPIRTHEPILKPDVVMVIDGNLASVLKEIKEYSSPLIINGSFETKDFKSKEIFLVDGTKISLEEIKINSPNIVLIGTLIKFLENKKINIIKYKDVSDVVCETFKEKRKEDLIIPNLNCLKRGYDNLIIKK